MTPSFWPLYHIPGLTGLSIKRTLGPILVLSGKNTIILKTNRESHVVKIIVLILSEISLEDIYSQSKTNRASKMMFNIAKYSRLNMISDESECLSSSINFPECLREYEDCHK